MELINKRTTNKKYGVSIAGILKKGVIKEVLYYSKREII
jgi:hypothetical protein